jgi:hypothetical protein
MEQLKEINKLAKEIERLSKLSPMEYLEEETYNRLESHDCKGEECNNPIHEQI